MIRNYLKMKALETTLKLQLYTGIRAFMKEKQDLAGLLLRLYTALKDVPAEELRDQFVEAVAKAVQGDGTAE